MKKRKWFFQEATLLVAVILLVVVSAWRDPKFLNSYNLQVIAREAALFGIMGIGETLVILTAGIDLSPGSLVALSGVVVAYLIVFAKFPISLAILTVILMGAHLARNFDCHLDGSVRWSVAWFFRNEVESPSFHHHFGNFERRKRIGNGDLHLGDGRTTDCQLAR